MDLTKDYWGSYDGQDVHLFKLDNGNMQVMLTNFGASITSITTPDKDGIKKNIVLGYDNLAAYIGDEFYTGCVIGRFAGRIANAQFSVNGSLYLLAQNDGDNSLHGGNKGFNKRVFTVTNSGVTDKMASVEFYYRSVHLEEGYPGNLDVWISYQLSASNQLTIKYKALTDKDTHVNLTNHSYFNLSGQQQSALGNQLFIDADNYLPTDKNHIPTGAIAPVKNTPYNFKIRRPITNSLPKFPDSGYNECYILNKDTGKPCAALSDAATGRELTVETDMPALLFYSGDYLGGKFLKNSGVCLETQYFPDSPNHNHFPGTLLKAGGEWESYTRFTFYWDKQPL
ncbi:MAG: aldose epimerase family protein [Bacteroidota bacterium]